MHRFTDHRHSRRHTCTLTKARSCRAHHRRSWCQSRIPIQRALTPEEAFVASLSSCHMMWFLDLAARDGWVADSYRDDAVGTLARNAESQQAMTRVLLRPAVLFAPERSPTPDELHDLHHRAHASCFIANSVKTEVVCEARIGSPTHS